jgi:sigma-E factor negative regulatory protein RseA
MFVGVMVLQQQLTSADSSAPIEIAQSMPLEYLEAHHAAAPNGAAYYIQNVNLSGVGQ